MQAISASDWNGIVDHVRRHYPNLTRSWFGQLEPVELEHGILDVRCANPPQQRYLGEYCARSFSEAAQAQTGRLVSVRFICDDNGHGRVSEASRRPAFVNELEQITLNPDYTFSQFVTAPSNRLAHAACVAVADAPGDAYNPLFVHGSVGLGKTHLLQAVCQELKRRRPDSRILFISCETFINHFIEAIESGALHQFRFRYRHADILLIDDIQFLAERERSQEEFFHTFNTLHQGRRQIVLSADCSPREIPSLEDRLVSRFNWGLVARIDPPCFETRMAIVRKKSRLRRIELPEDVVHFIASRVDTNTRELEGAITTVDAYCQQLGKPIDLTSARAALGDAPVVARQVTIPQIVEAVSQHFTVKKTDLQGKRRHKSIAFPRQVCMHLARELTPHSLGEIGSYFGGRDHTTVLHAVRQIDKLSAQDSHLSATLVELKSRLSNGSSP